MKTFRIISLIVILCVLSSCNFAANTNGGELSTEPEFISPYENLTDHDADITLPESEQFFWYKKPFLKATDIRPVKNELYRGAVYSYTPTAYSYNPTEYAAYYVGDKCGIVNSYGEILCDALYSDPYYCPEPDSIAFADHSLAYNFEAGEVVRSGGHGGGIDYLHYDINTDAFILICGSEGENEALEYDKTASYIVREAYMEISNQYEDYVAYNIDSTGKIGLYNNGKLVIPFEYVAAVEICEDVVSMYDGSDWTYFRTDGTVIMQNVQPNNDSITYYEKIGEDEYREITVPCVYSYSCGSVPVEKDGKWGYMDKNGEMLIDAEFDNALPAFENRAWVCVDGYWGIIEI